MIRSLEPKEIEFLTAIDNFKVKKRKLFLSWSEVLEIAHRLGYSRPAVQGREIDEKVWEDRTNELCEVIDDYKIEKKKLFLSWSEVLELIEGLGYRQAKNQS